MPVLQFKGKTAIENYHHTIPHHILEFDSDLSALNKGEKPALDGNLIIRRRQSAGAQGASAYARRTHQVHLHRSALQYRQRRLGLLMTI